jgi:hypothetical protein
MLQGKEDQGPEVAEFSSKEEFMDSGGKFNSTSENEAYWEGFRDGSSICGSACNEKVDWAKLSSQVKRDLWQHLRVKRPSCDLFLSS